MERLGIYGGTFSPPHNGHVHAARCFMENIKTDRLMIIPTYIPPHKTKTDSASVEERLDMCRLAFDFSDKIEISDIEIRRKGKSYTSDTLRALTKEGRQLFFLCGTDMLLTLDCWHEPEVIFALADIVCVAREDDMALRQSLKEKAEEYKVRFGARVHLLSVPAVELSSSRVRTAVMQDESLDGLLPEGVFAYIKEKGLYK